MAIFKQNLYKRKLSKPYLPSSMELLLFFYLADVQILSFPERVARVERYTLNPNSQATGSQWMLGPKVVIGCRAWPSLTASADIPRLIGSGLNHRSYCCCTVLREERVRQSRGGEGRGRGEEEKKLKPRCLMQSALAQPSELLGLAWDG